MFEPISAPLRRLLAASSCAPLRQVAEGILPRGRFPQPNDRCQLRGSRPVVLGRVFALDGEVAFVEWESGVRGRWPINQLESA